MATTARLPLPLQPATVPWPGRSWPRGELAPGVDRHALDRWVDDAFRDPPELGETHALLVVHRGAIVLERYATGMDAGTTHRSWSMAKSWLHAMVGILVRDGRLDVHARAAVPEWADPKDLRHAITLDDLLKMRSGLDFIEDYVESPADHHTVIEMLFGAGRDDVAAYAANCPLVHDPGAFFSYSSGTSNVVARLAADAAGRHGETWEAFMRGELFEPIGAASPKPQFDEAGTWIGSSYLFATAQDFARLGLLYLRDGVWDGRRLLPEGWVDYARAEHSRDETGRAYGAHFWVVPGSLGIFQCQGYEGQRTTMVPGLDLIVVRLGRTVADLSTNLDAFMKNVIDCFRASGR